MVSVHDRFIIDATFILKRIHDSFFGAPLLTVDGKDHTFAFGFARDILRLRRKLGVCGCVLVIGKDSRLVTSDQNIENTIAFLDRLEYPYYHDPLTATLAMVNYLCPHFSHIVTSDKRFLQLARENFGIVLMDVRNANQYTFYSRESIRTQIGVDPINVPTYLTLTTGSKNKTLTHRQAVGLIDLYGNLDAIYKNLSRISASSIRKKLADYVVDARQYYSESKIEPGRDTVSYQIKRVVANLDTNKRRQALREYGFHSLVDFLKKPTQSPLPTVLGEYNKASYNAVTNRESLQRLESQMILAKVCAIDTESDDTNPRNAQLLGVSFCVKNGEAYFVPLIENELEDISENDVLNFLKRMLHLEVDFIGHNIAYDYILLRKNGLEMKSVYFDTMLATYECHGDWEFFNLKYLAHRLLGRQIEAYRDLVDKNTTFLDLPFSELVRHGCQDADVTLRLYHLLSDRLNEKKLLKQYFNYAMSRLKEICELEFDGIPVDEDKINKIKELMVNQAVRLKDEVGRKLGKVGDIDSQKDILRILTDVFGIRRVGGITRVTLAHLEQLAMNEPTVRLIVRYKRLRRQIKKVDAIVAAIRGKRIYPRFNLVGSPAGLVATTKPRIFGIEGPHQLKRCFGRNVEPYFRDRQRALDTISELTQDPVLRKVRKSKHKIDTFMAKHPLMKNLEHDDLLLSLCISQSDLCLSRRFLVDRPTISTIRHDLEKRFQTLFKWLHKFRRDAAQNGYVTIAGRRKYLDGLKSSNVAKRKQALEHVVRWLMQI